MAWVAAANYLLKVSEDGSSLTLDSEHAWRIATLLRRTSNTSYFKCTLRDLEPAKLLSLSLSRGKVFGAEGGGGGKRRQHHHNLSRTHFSISGEEAAGRDGGFSLSVWPFAIENKGRGERGGGAEPGPGGEKQRRHCRIQRSRNT